MATRTGRENTASGRGGLSAQAAAASAHQSGARGHVHFSPVNGGSQYSAIRQGTAGIAPFFSSSVLLQPAVRRTGPLGIFFVFVRCS